MIRLKTRQTKSFELPSMSNRCDNGFLANSFVVNVHSVRIKTITQTDKPIFLH